MPHFYYDNANTNDRFALLILIAHAVGATVSVSFRSAVLCLLYCIFTVGFYFRFLQDSLQIPLPCSMCDKFSLAHTNFAGQHYDLLGISRPSGRIWT